MSAVIWWESSSYPTRDKTVPCWDNPRAPESNYKDFDRTVGKAVILVFLSLAFLVTNPVADGSFDDLPSTLERMISPLLRGDLWVYSDDNQTPPALRAPLSRGEAMLWKVHVV